MKRLAVLCLLLLPALPAAAAVVNIPDDDALYLQRSVSYELHGDGSWDMTIEHRVRLNTYYAVTRALGETFIVYNPDFQRLEVLRAETTMADGRKVPAPENAFNEVLPRAAHGFADFSGLREMVITHTGLERGAVIDLKYRIHTKPGFLPAFSGREVLSKDFAFASPHSVLDVSVPAGQELRYRFLGCDGITTDPKADGKTRFLALNFATEAHEPLGPAQPASLAFFTTARDWGQALSTKDILSPLPAALAEKVDSLKAKHPDRVDLLAALQKAVAVEVRNCPLGIDATGWRARPLERVFASNYGTALEKALLLKAMLKQAGVGSDLLAVAAGSAFAPDVPTPLQLGEFWLKVAEGPHALYLDPVREQHEFFPYAVQGLDAVNMGRGELEKMPAASREQNGVDVSGSVLLDPAGSSGTVVVSARGVFNRYGEAAADPGKFINGLLKKIFPVEKAEVKKVLQLTRREIRVEATFSGRWLKDIGGGHFSVDACRLPGVTESMAGAESRRSPLVLEAPFQVSLDLDLQPAAGLRLEYEAAEVMLKNEAGHFSRRQVQDRNGHVRFSESCAVELGMVGPKTYPLLRDLVRPYFAPGPWLVFWKGK